MYLDLVFSEVLVESDLKLSEFQSSCFLVNKA